MNEPLGKGVFDTIPVLDKGYVKLVDYMGTDIDICKAARTSYVNDEYSKLAEDKTDEENKRLIYRLLKDKHTSPFEMIEFKWQVKAPIFVFRQWHRHRTWSYNEYSGRYKELPEEFYVPHPKNIGFQSQVNKQGRNLKPSPDGENQIYADETIKSMKEANKQSFYFYRMMLKDGVPREIARSVLPSGTYSVMVAKTDLHNLMHFLKLRLDSHAQWEIQQYARALLQTIKPIVPTVYEWFMGE